MSHYEDKQESRRQYFLDKAEQAEAEANARAEQATRMSDAIPFGQPILVGHHSEQGDRSFRRRMGRQFEKSNEASRRAAYYRGKAASVGSGGISGDDENAADKIRAKLARLEETQELMKKANRVIRKHQRKGEDVPLAALIDLGFNDRVAREILQPDFMGRIGFVDYQLKNNNANIRRYRQRLAEVEAAAERENVTIDGDGYTFRLDADENRVMFEFPSKPDQDTRKLLNRHGFKWSRARMAWMRKWTDNGEYAGRQVKTCLDAE